MKVCVGQGVSISPTCRSDSHLSFATGSLEPFSAPSSRSFLESEEFFASDHAVTSVLSLERLYVWKQPPHNVLDLIGIIQDRGLSPRHQSLGDYFEGETPWVFLDLTDRLSSTEASFSLCLASELILLLSIPRATEDHPLSPTKLIYEPGFFKMFAKLVFVESFCVPGGAPHLAHTSCYLDMLANAAVHPPHPQLFSRGEKE